ncbi:MAG: M50 family metallopeptidase [Chlamydiales bacterium]|nr:M50 family metallopeptidase [Chlamydiales bacterium]
MMNLKIPLRIHPFFWLFAALIGFLNSNEPIQILVWVFIIFISVLIHECGHALTAKLFQQSVHIELFAFGGMTYREGRKLKLWEEFLVVLCGPLAGFLLFLLGYFLLPHIGDKQSLLFFSVNILTIINFLWTCLNLIPVLPLDGGQLLRIVLEKIIGFKAIKITHLISLFLATGLTFLFLVEGQIFVGILFFMLAFMSYRSFKDSKLMSVQDQNADLQRLFEDAEKKLLLGMKREAFEDFQKVRKLSSSGVIYNIATETSALILLEESANDPEKKALAYQCLCSLPSVSAEVLPRFHALAFEYDNYQKTVELAEEAFQLQPTGDTALITAKAYAALKMSEPAVGWLECALSEGVVDIDKILKNSEFDLIRDNIEFKHFVDSIQGV